jgi:flagellar biosynthesis/type III secretory pathway chaperone
LERRSVGEGHLPHLSPILAEEVQQVNPCVEDILEELAGILDVELEQYRNLLSLLHVQREYFAAGDIASFEEISKKQGTTILKIKTLEEARKSIVSRIVEYFDVPQDEFTLAKLADLVDSPHSELCAAYQQEILSLVRELESIRESNAYLIQHALHYVSGVLKIFAAADKTDPAYSNNGKLEHKTKKGKYLSGWG